MRTRVARAGFTLVEVMIALAILGVALVVLVRSVAGNIASAGESFYMGIATDLARGKMYDLEEQLVQEGFQETEQELEGDFSDEGWPGVTWKATITPSELPPLEKLMGMQEGQPGAEGAGQGTGTGSGSGSGEGGEQAMDKFNNSALGGMLGMLGGGGGSGSGSPDAQDAQTGGFIAQFYPLVQQVLKASIRKIKLTIEYSTGLRKERFDVVLYVTDTAGLAKTLAGMGMWKP